MVVRVARTDDEREAVFAVRRAVFVAEQGVDPALEYDEHDDAATVDHLLALAVGTGATGDDVDVAAGDAVGAARLRPHPDRESTAKLERVAVREPRRGDGWGRRLVCTAHGRARERGFERVHIHAQVPVTGFYERLGYRQVSEEFEEAGMPHVAMTCDLGEAVVDDAE
ncbi:MAG: GNAT family N-acetyltransferase [Halobacteriaceae archaeon]